MADGALGNVVSSRPFQFALIETASSTAIGRQILWTPHLPEHPQRVTRRWIYAFELGERPADQKPILAAEYHADAKGALGFVAGARRRLVDATENGAPAPAPVPDVTLPLVRQGRPLRHVFVATRGRLHKAAIRRMEDTLPAIYQRLNLADDYVFKRDPKGDPATVFVPIIDPLTIAENLNQSYQEALNEALNQTVVHPNNPRNAEVEIESRKYQLAQMIKENLLMPDGDKSDPFSLREYMAGYGRGMLDFMEERESKIRKPDWRRRNTALDIVRFLDGEVWVEAFRWYMGTADSATEIGHLWFESTLLSIDRLGETPEGRGLLRKLVEDREDGLLSYLFPPEGKQEGGEHEGGEGGEGEHERREEMREKEAEAAAEQRFLERFAIVRKVATAAVIGFCETAPALVAYGLSKRAARSVRRTLKMMLRSTQVSLVKRAPGGQVAALMQVTTHSLHIDIDFKQAKVDLSKWIEEGKPHWPEHHKLARAAELVSRLFIGVEIWNLHNETEELRKGKGEPLKVVGAVIDLVVAAEDPIRALATRLAAEHKTAFGREAAHAAKAELSAGARHAAVAAGEAEAKSLVERVVMPAAFKFLGAASAAIDFYFALGELEKRRTGGDSAGAVGQRFLVGGSALIGISSMLNGIGYLMSSLVLTGPASCLLVAGVVLVVVGNLIVSIVSTSNWQKFVRHSVFGDKPASKGQENWSGGDFSAWTPTADGLDRQIRVLTSMLCTFDVAGIGFDAQTVTVRFGIIPPRATLHVDFFIEYENGVRARPGYLFNLENHRLLCTNDSIPAARCEPYSVGGQLRSLLLTAARPGDAANHRVVDSTCLVSIHYGEDQSNQATIPMGRAIDYRLFRGSGMASFNKVNSLDGD